MKLDCGDASFFFFVFGDMSITCRTEVYGGGGKGLDHRMKFDVLRS